MSGVSARWLVLGSGFIPEHVLYCIESRATCGTHGCKTKVPQAVKANLILELLAGARTDSQDDQ
jgi:hypothetical protein